MPNLKKSWKNTWTEILICLLISLFVVTITQIVSIAPLEQLKLKLLDERFKDRGPIELKDPDVVIIEITQETYDEIPYQWPWPKTVFAHLIKNLNEAGVRAIGLDLIMSNPDNYYPKNDSILIESIRKYKNVVVAGKVDIERESKINKYTSFNEQEVHQGGVIKKVDENFGSIFYSADSSIGIVQVPNDNDGVHRRYRPFIYSSVTETRVPSFGFAVLNKYLNLDQRTTAINEEKFFVLGEKKIPKFNSNSMLINFYGADRTFPRYKMIDVLDDKDFQTVSEIDLETDLNAWDDPDFGLLYSDVFKDKIVLIGSTMPEDRDILAVSVSKGDVQGNNLMYGVEIHANAIQNVLRNEYIVKQPVSLEIALTFFFTIYAFFLSSLLRKYKKIKSSYIEYINILVTAIFIFIIYKLSIYIFEENNYIISIASPSLAVLLGHFGNTLYHFLKERKQNVMIKGMFSTYVSGQLVNQLIANPDQLKLGGEKKNLSILFSDIAGFTTFSEGKEPEELVAFINEFLDEMSEIILNNQGTVDKYLGDAVMAFWGAPLPIDNHAYLACKTAIEMNNKLLELQKQWGSQGKQAIGMRIGVNTGDVVVGNIGGKNRFDYTVMGDSVNLASRLEGANKAYGTQMMISGATYKMVKNKFLVRELDNMRVKGKKKPTRVYELLGFIDDPAAIDKLDKLKHYLKGLEHYKKREFGFAKAEFEKSLNLILEDQPSQEYFDRSNFYMENPPEQDWDGVFIMTTK
ncbi:MAG: adenylate/guanylate cyclase domain-containing protein [Bacteroidetes bacterium]|nr:adenylate/guanylate cyclase domain-containing protein [Bacteroidota bacterium]